MRRGSRSSVFGDVCDREVNVVSADVAYVGPLRRAAFGTTRGSGSATKASPRTKDNVYAPSDEVAVGLFCLSSHVQLRLCSSLRIVWTVAIRRAIQSRSGGRGIGRRIAPRQRLPLSGLRGPRRVGDPCALDSHSRLSPAGRMKVRRHMPQSQTFEHSILTNPMPQILAQNRKLWSITAAKTPHRDRVDQCGASARSKGLEPPTF